jgi:Uma2 family endonuclease
MLWIDAWLDEKPYKEIYDGVIHEKVSPQRRHNLVAAAVCRLLRAWGHSFGEALPEQRVHLAEGITLVPDVVFISDRRSEPLSEREREAPPLAPDIVVEVRSPDDRTSRIARKTELYLEFGTLLVLEIDPEKRTVTVISNTQRRMLGSGDVLEHDAFPDLRIPIADIFADLDRKRRP